MSVTGITNLFSYDAYKCGAPLTPTYSPAETLQPAPPMSPKTTSRSLYAFHASP
ncbi:MAG: hypothetical protein QXN15_03565 [Candidatus Jordarchaeales archaeon]